MITPGTNINSSTLLAWLQKHYPENEKVNIGELARLLNIGTSPLLSILTELEHRDEIKIEISSQTDPATNEQEYSGTVQLMGTPPDEGNQEY